MALLFLFICCLLMGTMKLNFYKKKPLRGVVSAHDECYRIWIGVERNHTVPLLYVYASKLSISVFIFIYNYLKALNCNKKRTPD